MKALTKRLLIGASALSLSACATNSERFHWGNYEPALYRYTVHPESREDYRAALAKAAEVGRKGNSVAPGLLAELGYLYLEDGKSDEANALFAEEMQRFPESKAFLEGLKARHDAAAPPAASANQGAPSPDSKVHS